MSVEFAEVRESALTVERTNSWMSNFGQLRRNTDRFIHHRLDQISLAGALVITVKRFKWADRWSPTTWPIAERSNLMVLYMELWPTQKSLSL